MTIEKRKIVVERKVKDPVTFDRGTLVIMYYDDSKDGGYYKCDASYNSGVSGLGKSATYPVAQYRLIASSLFSLFYYYSVFNTKVTLHTVKYDNE